MPKSSESDRLAALPSARTAFALLATARLVSAALNIVHDCDEVYNYWEPLHYLLFGSGMQTWEYSSAYALRSYLYLLLHGAVAAPAALLFGNGRGACGSAAASPPPGHQPLPLAWRPPRPSPAPAPPQPCPCL